MDRGLEGWIERHGSELRRHLTRMLGAEADAEDVLQELWITAYRRPPDTGPGSNVRAWLYRVATNAALDRLAKDHRRCALLDGKGFRLAPDRRAPDEGLGVLSEQARRRVREHVASLPRKQREAVWLRWVEGRDYETIAREIDSSVESARANVFQGMKRLRAELFELWQRENAS
ncbi:MAG: RNA polymerase sigma factor [Gemmatimonadota bacterium]